MNSQEYHSLQEAYMNVYREVDEAVYGGESKKPEAPKDKRLVVTNADKTGNTPAYQNFKKGDPRYKAADHMGEGVRDLDSEKGTAERKARLEKKRGMKLDDHPEYKKETSVDEEHKPLPKEKMARQADRAYGKETRAVAAGDEKETNKQMQRRNAMQMPASRRTSLENKKKVTKEEVDIFDTILEYLVAEGYADTNEAALVIMGNMSEQWRDSIVEGKSDRPLGYMHPFARGVKQTKGEKREVKYGQDTEGNMTGKYAKIQKSKKST